MSKVEQGNWIHLYRELLDKPIWVDSTPEQKTILITILLMVQFHPQKRDFNKELITVNPGQQVTGYQAIANKCGKGVTIRNVRTALKKFERYGFLTYKTTNKGMLLSVENWGIYQNADKQTDKQSDKQLTSNRQATDKQLTTNKKERKKESEEGKNKPSKPPKKNFADYVKMTEEQYEKLVADYGKQQADDMIERLNEYKGSKGKRYKDDYLTCKSWFRKDGVKPQEKEKERDYKIFGDDPADLEGIDIDNVPF